MNEFLKELQSLLEKNGAEIASFEGQLFITFNGLTVSDIFDEENYGDYCSFEYSINSEEVKEMIELGEKK